MAAKNSPKHHPLHLTNLYSLGHITLLPISNISMKNPLPTPTNTQKWAAQNKGFDADYIPGQDDGEFIKREIDEDLVRVDEVETAQQLSKLGIY